MSRIYRNDMLFLATANFKHMPDDILKHISGYLPRSWRAPLPCRRELALIDFIEKGAKKKQGNSSWGKKKKSKKKIQMQLLEVGEEI